MSTSLSFRGILLEVRRNNPFASWYRVTADLVLPDRIQTLSQDPVETAQKADPAFWSYQRADLELPKNRHVLTTVNSPALSHGKSYLC